MTTRWQNRVELDYRVFVRQFEDFEGRLTELYGRLSETSMGEAEEIEFGDPWDTYWPLRPEDIDNAQTRGLLVVYRGAAKPHVVVRRLIVTIPYTPMYGDESTDIIDEVNDAVGLGQFVKVSIVREFQQDLQAI